VTTVRSMEALVERVSEELFAEPSANVYAVLDGASIANLPDRLYELSPVFCCLFRGELSPDMAEVAPYLVELEQGSEFTNWLIGQGWGKHWGIFVRSDADFRALRRHLRSFLIVYDGTTGRPMRFRYYDPRVLPLYLPTCNREELATVFGPVADFLLESEDPCTALRLQLAGEALVEERIGLAAD
jgi:hypothetical protein